LPQEAKEEEEAAGTKTITTKSNLAGDLKLPSIFHLFLSISLSTFRGISLGFV